MHILVVEDNDEKFNKVSEHISALLKDVAYKIQRAIYFSDATRLIFEEKFDIIIIDLMLPLRKDNNTPVDISSEIVEHLQDSEKNKASTVIAITMFNDLVDGLARKFHEAGVYLLHYDKNNDSWKGGLEICLERVKIEHAFDFIIFCALEKERAAFEYADCQIGELKAFFGLDCQEIKIDDFNGLIVMPPRMGLVDAAIICSRCLERFSPKLICMAGICAGIEDNSQLGTLVVSERAWEHQAGKWSKDKKFKLDAYQANIDNFVRVKLEQYTKKKDEMAAIRTEGFIGNPLVNAPSIVAPTVSGSSVVASAEKVAEIADDHRKLGGLDMETYGLYRAVELSTQNPMFFSAKTVVDLANEAKGDQHHVFGATLSARFVVGAVRLLLSEHAE